MSQCLNTDLEAERLQIIPSSYLQMRNVID